MSFVIDENKTSLLVCPILGKDNIARREVLQHSSKDSKKIKLLLILP